MKDILIKDIGTKDYALFFQELSNVVGEHCYSFEIDNEYTGHQQIKDMIDEWAKEYGLVKFGFEKALNQLRSKL